MDYADFVHLARTSEQASAENSQAYRRSVMWFAALGYLWVLGCVALAIALLAVGVPRLLAGGLGFSWIMLVVAALGLLWVSLRSLWVHIEPPDGIRLSKEEAPDLYKALERIRQRIKGPPIHEVYLNDEFNASVGQVPRWGIFGGSINRLVIGLPMLMALDKRRMLAVLAHEYGHLRGDHGKFSAWVYRTRRSWSRLYNSMEDSASPFAVATQAFLRWYSPRFLARTFAMARQDEYEADRIAAKMLGRDEMIASLIEVRIKDEWVDTRFWSLHWAQAVREPLPVGPFQSMQRLLREPPTPEFATETLRRALKTLSSVDDTHPVLKERLAALGEKRVVLPVNWSAQGSLDLLGSAGPHWVAQFDREWSKENADEWKLQRARLQRARDRVLELQARGAGRSVAEQVEAAQLIRRINPGSTAATGLFQQALQRDPTHAQALIGMVHGLMESDPQRSLQFLERLWTHHPTWRMVAARTALEELETPREGRDHQPEALTLWRERRREAENAEVEVMQELSRSPLLESVLPHQLSPFQLAELQAELARWLPLRQAWLVRKPIAAMPDRPAHALLVAFHRADEAAQRQWCAELEQRVELEGMVMVSPVDVVAARESLVRLAGDPVYVRGA